VAEEVSVGVDSIGGNSSVSLICGVAVRVWQRGSGYLSQYLLPAGAAATWDKKETPRAKSISSLLLAFIDYPPRVFG